MEELIAEMGAAFLAAHCCLDGQLQHANYIASWLEVLKRRDAIHRDAHRAVYSLWKERSSPGPVDRSWDRPVDTTRILGLR